MIQFTDVLEEYGVSCLSEGHHHCREGWIQFDCPFCSPGSNRYRMGFSLKTSATICWTCSYHPLVDTLTEITGDVSKSKSLAYTISKKQGFNLTITNARKGRLVIPTGVGPLLEPHKRYLRDRGFDVEELVKLWDIRGIGLAAKLAWRIFIPTYLGGNIVSWTTRSIGEVKSKYVNASPKEEAIPIKSFLLGQDYVRHAVIVCEGPFDAMRIGPGATATLGTHYTRAQVRQAIKFPVRVVCFDNEVEAQKRAIIFCRELQAYPGKTYNVCLDAKDPGSASKKEIRLLRKSFLE